MQPLPRGVLRRRVLVAVVLAIAGIGIAGLGVWRATRPTSVELLGAARRALIGEDFAEAERLAGRVLSGDPQSADALLIAGDAATRQQRFEEALDYYDRVPIDRDPQAADARAFAGRILLYHLHRPAEAESRFRGALELDPRHVAAHHGMYNLLAIAGCRWRMVPHVLELIRQDSYFVSQLVLLNSGEGTFGNLELLRECQSASPDDPFVLLGLSQQALRDGRKGEAKRLAKRAVHSRPDFVEAQLHLGTIVFESSSPFEFARWHARLPDVADEHPEVWVLRGAWARRQAEPRTAVRCYWEALRRDPSHRAANYQLSQILIALGEKDDAAPFLERAPALEALEWIQSNDFDNRVAARNRESDDALHKVVGLMKSLGRAWEAWGWCRAAQELNPHLPWASAEVARLERLLHRDSPLTLPEANPALHVDLSRYPLPDWNTEHSAGTGISATPRSTSRVSFEDRAASAGLEFVYNNGGEPTGKEMYAFTGGGVAVIDYDADGWPDIYLTQGCAWPPDETQREHLDRLYRNLGDGRFVEVAQAAGIAENGFSQGATVGDYNGDGFADLYVANVGGNRFYENNGDGTFSDITRQTGTAGDSWSTSCLLADVNGHGLPDLYVVNYLEGDDVFSRLCPDSEGVIRSCSPRHFDAAQDRLYLNRGDGRFDDVTNRVGILEPGSVNPDGKGLGIVAADLDGTGRLSLFVANDAVPNFLFVNRGSTPQAELAFEERALTAGLAVNEDGRPEACMGVAAGDADGDGLLDLFVTNFFNESNTMFRQQSPGQFVDSTRRFRLHEPSLKMLGFGTQFVDGELDGLLDLVVTNGHVDDLSDIGQRYEMPCEYFSNRGNSHFARVAPEELGPYFQEMHLGRALARLDWNRDGLDDVVISHLDAPAALLTNTTRDAGNFVAIRLVGVASSRDAIGTTLTAAVGDRKLMRQLTAGDGYQASNERRITFGLGADRQIDALEVRWPSGTIDRYDKVAGNREMLIVEGRGVYLLPPTK